MKQTTTAAILLAMMAPFLISGCGKRSQVAVPQEVTTQEDSEEATADEFTSTDPPNAALLDPALATETAPEIFHVKVETTKGDFVIEVTRSWSPNGADRFYNLVKIGFYENIAIFRAIENFMFQFGIHGNPNVSRKWSKAKIKDDAVKGIPNEKGYISFAKSLQKNSRTCQLFINLKNNTALKQQGFTPFGLVISGFSILDEINTEYGEVPGEIRIMLEQQGNTYLQKRLPNIDYIKRMSLVEMESTGSTSDDAAAGEAEEGDSTGETDDENQESEKASSESEKSDQ